METKREKERKRDSYFSFRRFIRTVIVFRLLSPVNNTQFSQMYSFHWTYRKWIGCLREHCWIDWNSVSDLIDLNNALSCAYLMNVNILLRKFLEMVERLICLSGLKWVHIGCGAIEYGDVLCLRFACVKNRIKCQNRFG